MHFIHNLFYYYKSEAIKIYQNFLFYLLFYDFNDNYKIK